MAKTIECTERQVEALFNQVKPIGHLPGTGPSNWPYPSVMTIRGDYYMMIPAKTEFPSPARTLLVQLEPGTKIQLWSGKVIEA